MRASSPRSPHLLGVRLALVAFATTAIAACNAIFGINGGLPAGPSGSGGATSSGSSGSGGKASTSSSGTGGMMSTSTSGTGGMMSTSSSGTGGAIADAGPVCDGNAPGSEGTNAIWALNAGGFWAQMGYAVAFGKAQTFVVAGTYADGETALGSGPLPYTSSYPDAGSGGDDIFVARYDLAGQNVWARGFGGPDDQGLASFLYQRNNALRVAVDAQDNVVLAGNYRGSFTIGSTLTNDTSRHADAVDAFVAKLDAAGNPLWAKPLGGPDNDLVLGLGVDSQGNIVFAALTANLDATALSVNFGCGAENVDPQPQSTGEQWLFVSKLGPDGSCVWHQRFQIDSGFNDVINIGAGLSLAVDPFDDVILALGADASRTYIGSGNIGSSQGRDVILAKLAHTDGHVLWRKAYGGPGAQRAWAVATDGCGNIVVGGEFDEAAAFGALAPLQLPADSGADPQSTHAFVLKLDLDADPAKPPAPVWARAFADDGWQSVTGVAVDGAGKVTVIGNLIDGPASMGVDFGDGVLTPPVPDDAGNWGYHPAFYFAKLNADGTLHHARRFGDDHANNAYGVAVDSAGHTVMTGAAQMKIDFGGGASPLDPNNIDVFVVMYGP